MWTKHAIYRVGPCIILYPRAPIAYGVLNLFLLLD